MILSNVLVLALNHRSLVTFLLQDERFHLVDGTDDVNLAQCLLQKKHYDILIIQDTLPGTDGAHYLHVLAQNRSPIMPRTLLLTSFAQTETTDYDAYLPIDVPLSSIANAAHKLWELPVPALCRANFQSRMDIAHSILSDMNMPVSFKGTKAIACGAAILSCCCRNDLPVGKWLYPHIASRLGCSPADVERNIRTAAEYTWLKGNLDSIHRYFGISYDANKGKPTNAELLYTLADHVRRKL